jgi:arginase
MLLLVPPGPECASQVLTALGEEPVYIHIDWDVLDPSYFPTEYKVSGGLLPAELRSVLSAVVIGHEIVGLETAEFEAPEDSMAQQAGIHTALDVLAPLLEVWRRDSGKDSRIEDTTS